jgi:phage shock protein E
LLTTSASTKKRSGVHTIKLQTVLLSILIALTSSSCEAPVQKDADITADVLLQKINNNDAPLILDVRTEDEFSRGHLPGAVNISHAEIFSRLSELPSNKSATVVLHCQAGPRAELAANVLREAGFSNLLILSGHYAEWSDRNLPLEQGVTR